MSIEKYVFWIGTGLNSHGGISQLEKSIIENWPNCQYKIRHIVTHEDGCGLHKITVFIKSIFILIYRIICDNPEIIHAHFSINASIFRKSIIVLLAKLFKIKIILQSHTGEFDRYFSQLNSSIQLYLKYVFNLADGLIILSENDRLIYEKYFNCSAIYVLRNPINKKTRQSSLENHQIITVGSLGHRKGTYDLLKAIPLVLAEFPDVKFFLIGDGDVNEIKKEVQTSGFTQNVIITGWIDHDELVNYYCDSCLFVLPSYFEGMPIAILEAMSFGLPVISTKVNGIPDVVADGETGLLIQPGDFQDLSWSIISLLRNNDLRIKMGENSKKRIETDFTFPKITSEIISIYNRIVLGESYYE